MNVTSGSEEALKVAIASRGPVSVAIDASHKSLSFYSNGQLDHIFVVVALCLSQESIMSRSVAALTWTTRFLQLAMAQLEGKTTGWCKKEHIFLSKVN